MYQSDSERTRGLEETQFLTVRKGSDILDGSSRPVTFPHPQMGPVQDNPQLLPCPPAQIHHAWEHT